MPRYGHAGPGQLRRLDSEYSGERDIEAPSSPDAAGEAEKVLLQCKAPAIEDGQEECDRKFIHRGTFARHFNSTHSDLMEDEDSWRDYFEEIVQEV